MNFKIDKTEIQEFSQPYIIAEIGINHNGDLRIAKRLIDVALAAGCNAVKFQKRDIGIVYNDKVLSELRDSPFGSTNGDLKRALEFGVDEYQEIDAYCKSIGITWFASPWDVNSVDFLDELGVPCHKVASAMLTHTELLKKLASTCKPLIVSTGMSSIPEIDVAMEILKNNDVLLMHTTSTYPCEESDVNLEVISTLRRRYNRIVGYSGHEVGILPSLAAVIAYGACAIERHITLDRAMYGSDQSASLEPEGLKRLNNYIRSWFISKGSGNKDVLKAEIPIQKKLRYFQQPN